MAHDVGVSGDAVGGFIVEVHDGERFECYPLHAADEAAAREAALAHFVAGTMPQPVQTQPEAPQ